ncbi:MAG: APC family permease [Deltaproteobacteria bacterium]|nr:APC family permease [Deltaproteobacteria bacterium]
MPQGKPAAWGGGSHRNPRGLGFWQVTAIGVGGMVGGGIFAVLGLAVHLAGGGTPAAFALAGGVAALTAYSYTKLSVTFPDQGGTVIFLDQAFGRCFLTGSLNVLLWESYVVMLALYSYAFGSYAATFLPPGTGPWAKHLLISLGILLPTALNLLQAELVGRAETYVVVIKVVLLLLFVSLGVFSIEPARLSLAAWAPPLSLAAGGMIIFVAYEGFELIANTAQDVRDQRLVLPRAYGAAVGFVIVLYILVALVTVGSLSLADIASARDFALAAAAKPFLGQAGFRLIGLAAVLSTFSAINATLYGSARLSYTIAREGELPEALEKKIWGKPLEGLFLTAALALLLANLADLSSISTLGSAGFLVIFAAVNLAHQRLCGQTGGRPGLAWAGAAACLAALAALVWRTAEQDATRLWFLLVLLGLPALVEAVYGRVRQRRSGSRGGDAAARNPAEGPDG